MSRFEPDQPADDKPGHDVLTAALHLAVRAPSLHNTQPWRWLVDPGAVHLHADSTRRLPGTDAGGREMVISCGAALQHFLVALAAAGWRGRTRRLPTPADPGCLAVVGFEAAPVTAADAALAAAIPRRRTDRRRFGSWPVPSELVGELLEVADLHGVRLQPISEPRQRRKLFSVVADAAERHATDPAQVAELAAWSGRAAGATDGVPATAAPAPQRVAGQPPMRAFVRPARPAPVRAAASPEPEASELLLLSTAGDSPLQWLRAGEIAANGLLAATRDGLASSLLTEPLEDADTRGYLKSSVVRSEVWSPQLLLRIGWPVQEAAELPPVPRRPLAEVVTALDARVACR